MAIIQFTEADRLAGKVLEKGAYRVIISEIDGPKASTSQKSVSFFVKFKIIEGPYIGKELQIAFNSGTSNASILGSLQFLPQRDFLKVKAAIENIPFDSVTLENFDTDALLNRPMDVIVGVETTEDGNLMNPITNFLPAGKGDAKQPF